MDCQFRTGHCCTHTLLHGLDQDDNVCGEGSEQGDDDVPRAAEVRADRHVQVVQGGNEKVARRNNLINL